MLVEATLDSTFMPHPVYPSSYSFHPSVKRALAHNQRLLSPATPSLHIASTLAAAALRPSAPIVRRLPILLSSSPKQSQTAIVSKAQWGMENQCTLNFVVNKRPTGSVSAATCAHEIALIRLQIRAYSCNRNTILVFVEVNRINMFAMHQVVSIHLQASVYHRAAIPLATPVLISDLRCGCASPVAPALTIGFAGDCVHIADTCWVTAFLHQRRSEHDWRLRCRDISFSIQNHI